MWRSEATPLPLNLRVEIAMTTFEDSPSTVRLDEEQTTPGGMSWPERIANYRQLIGVPYLGHENGWTYGTWFMGNSYEKKTDYYGGFQGNFLKRIAALFPDRRR